MKTVGVMVLSLCAVSVVAGVCRILAPSGAMGKSVGILTGVFVLACFITPFFSMNSWEFSLPTVTQQTAAANINRDLQPLLEETAKQEIIELVEQLANQEEIHLSSVAVATSFRDNQVWIDEIVIGVTDGNGNIIQEKLADTVTCSVIVEAR